MSKDNKTTNLTVEAVASDAAVTPGSITFALAQSHFLVGDISTNVEKMRTLALEAREQGADVIIFPELALLGYPPQDLLLRPSLSGRIKSALASLSDINDIVMIIGYPHVDHHARLTLLPSCIMVIKKVFIINSIYQIMASLMNVVILIKVAIKSYSIIKALPSVCLFVKTYGRRILSRS